MKIKEIRALTGLSQVKFANAYGIPVSTLENWERGTRSCPDYVLDLLEFKVKTDIERGHVTMENVKIWKVYGQNVRKPAGAGVVEISEEEARVLIGSHLDFKMEFVSFPEDASDDEISEIAERFCSAGYDDFKRHGFYGCGDFDIVVSAEKPERPNRASDDMPDGFC